MGPFSLEIIMPLTVQKEWFTKEQIRANPKTWFVFGDNEMRQGTGGQAKPCRGEPNTIGIRTKRKPLTAPDAYWHDSDYARNKKLVTEDFYVVYQKLRAGNKVIFPADGFGTGLALLEQNAPKTLAYIWGCYNSLVEVYGE